MRIIILMPLLLMACVHHPSSADHSASPAPTPAIARDSVPVPPPVATTGKSADEQHVWHWPPGPPKDTTLDISIDNVSEEGSDITAVYTKDSIRTTNWSSMGETGRDVIIYTFDWNGTIDVKDVRTKYKVPFDQLKSDKDMVSDSIEFKIDTNGVVISGRDRLANVDRDTAGVRDIFSVFRKNVPLILRSPR